MLIRIPRRLWLGCIACALLVSAKATEESSTKTIRVGYLPATHDTLLFIAKEQQLFPSTLNVELTAGRVSPDLLEKLKSGAIDVAIPGVAAPINAIARGAEFCMVGGAARESAAVVARSDLAGLFKSPETQATLKAFSGMRVGSLKQSTGDAIFRMNIKGRTDITLIDSYKSPGELINDLKGGKLDAAVLWSPHMTIVEQQGIGKIVLWLGEVMPGHVCCRQVVRDDYLKANEDAVIAYLAGMIRAMYYYSDQANREKVIGMVKKYIATSPDVIAVELYGDGKSRPRTTISVDVDVDGIRNYAHAMEVAGLIQPEESSLVDRSIYPAAMSKAYQLIGLTEAQAKSAVLHGFDSAKADLAKVVHSD